MKTDLQRRAYASPWSNGMPGLPKPPMEIRGRTAIGLSLNK